MYDDKDRQIFQYYNGAELVFGDPMAIYKQILIQTSGRPDELDRKVFRPVAKLNPAEVSESAQAHQQLCQLVRQVFGMKDYNPADNTGAMDEHCIMAWKGLARELNEKKNRAVNLQTESPSTDGPPDSQTAIQSTSV